jgi:hypothetical protein
LRSEGDRVPTHKPSLWLFLAVLCLIAFGLNWPWEMAQMPAYAETAGRSWLQTALPCTVAALGDVVLTLIVCGLGALAAGRAGWGMEGSWNVYAAAALLGGVCALAFEWHALASGRWSYDERMPVVPLLGVGLWLLLQLVLLTPVSLGAARWFVGRMSRNRRTEEPLP